MWEPPSQSRPTAKTSRHQAPSREESAHPMAHITRAAAVGERARRECRSRAPTPIRARLCLRRGGGSLAPPTTLRRPRTEGGRNLPRGHADDGELRIRAPYNPCGTFGVRADIESILR